MAVLDLSAPAQLPYTFAVTLGSSNVSQEIRLPANMDARVTFYFETNDGKLSTTPATTDGEAIDNNYMPVPSDAPYAQDFVGPGHVTAFVVASATGSTVLRGILERAPTAGAR